jgi:hypothetical protein
VRCHFLRTVGADGRLLDAQRTAVPTHRCAAFGDPLPLSLRQQELVCLQRVHVSCPRYVRGTLLASENQETVVQEQTRQPVPVLSIVGIGLVVLAIVVGGSAAMGLGPFKGKPGPTVPMVVVSPTPSSATASPTIAVTASPSAAPSATASAQPSATASASATPTASPTPAASATWPPGATASRMNLLVPCTGQADCWVYTVRGGGPPPAGNGSGSPDTVINIARFFGVTTADIYDLNSWARSGIKAGDKLKIPPPTR